MESISDLVDSEYISIVVSILKMLALLLIVNHVIACVWFWIGDLHGGGGWIEAHQLNDAAWDYQYATSLHWAITQFTPASMHVQPHTLSERMFAIGTVVFALVGFSYVVGSISGSLAQLRGMTENRARQFWELRRHLRKNHVSITLSARIQKYAEHVLESQEDNVPAKDVKLLSVLSEQLRSELECASGRTKSSLVWLRCSGHFHLRRDLHAALFGPSTLRETLCCLSCYNTPTGEQCDLQQALGTN